MPRLPAKTTISDNPHAPCGTRVRYASTRQCVHCHRAKMRGKSVEFLAQQQSPPPAEVVRDEHNQHNAFINDPDIGDLL